MTTPTVTISRELLEQWEEDAQRQGNRFITNSIRAALNAQPEQQKPSAANNFGKPYGFAVVVASGKDKGMVNGGTYTFRNEAEKVIKDYPDLYGDHEVLPLYPPTEQPAQPEQGERAELSDKVADATIDADLPPNWCLENLDKLTRFASALQSSQPEPQQGKSYTYTNPIVPIIKPTTLPGKMLALYLAASNLMVYLGREGAIQSDEHAADTLMNCLHDLDGGEFNDQLFSSQPEPAGELPPFDVIHAATKVSRWAKERDVKNWRIADCCSEDYARAAIAQSKVPEGYALFPVEATWDMMKAAEKYYSDTTNTPKGQWWWNRLYQAYISAAPQAAQPQASEPVFINGLTEAETNVTMSVRGLSEPKASEPLSHAKPETAPPPEGAAITPEKGTEWAHKAMELATDFAIDSLRVGSYERKDQFLNNHVATYQTIELREKREASRRRLRQFLFSAQFSDAGKKVDIDCRQCDFAIPAVAVNSNSDKFECWQPCTNGGKFTKLEPVQLYRRGV